MALPVRAHIHCTRASRVVSVTNTLAEFFSTARFLGPLFDYRLSWYTPLGGPIPSWIQFWRCGAAARQLVKYNRSTFSAQASECLSCACFCRCCCCRPFRNLFLTGLRCRVVVVRGCACRRRSRRTAGPFPQAFAIELAGRMSWGTLSLLCER